MTDLEISAAFWIGIKEAVKIRNSTLEQMIDNELICPQVISSANKYMCRWKKVKCRECVGRFLKAEVEKEEMK
jgi:hypothetical protein